MGEVIEIPQQGVWRPNREQFAGPSRQKAFIVIAGTSGCGKSHTARQLALDKRFGSQEVVVAMAEDATATYGDAIPLTNIHRCSTIASAHALLEEYIRASRSGHRMPKVFVVDSVSGLVDYQMQSYKRQPMISEKTGNRDKFAEFGDLGEQIRDFAMLCRDEAPMDVVWLVTTYEIFGQPPEYAVAGKVIPANLTRWTTSTLYMRAKEDKIDPEVIKAKGTEAEAPHRTIGRDEKGEPTGQIINRFFVCMNTGEIQAKGHRNLGLIERAYLPDVLSKIKGE